MISRVPNHKTLSELRRLLYAFPAMGEFPDVVHRDATLGFTEYAYAVGAVQPDVPRTIQEARASLDAAKWNAAAERETKSLNDRKVYKLVPRSAVPEAHQVRVGVQTQSRRLFQGTCRGPGLEPSSRTRLRQHLRSGVQDPERANGGVHHRGVQPHLQPD